MKFGMHYIYWQKDLDAVTYTSHLRRAHQAGFDVLELGDDILVKMSDQQVTELAAEKNVLGMDLSLGLDPPAAGELTAEDRQSRQRGIDYYEQIFPRLEQLGITTLAGRLLYTSSHQPCIKVQTDDIERGKESLAVLAASARNYGVTLNIEVCNRYETHIVNTAEQGVAFVKDLNEPNVKLLLDTYHMNIEEASFGEAIMTAGEYLGHLHIIENNRRLPGRGHVPWSDVAVALRKINYQGMANMEPLVRTGGQLADFCRIWRDLTDDADDLQMDRHAAESLQFIKFIMES